MELNGDLLSPLNVVGLVMCLAGISSHVVHKYRTLVNSGKRAGLAAAMNGDILADPSDDGEDCVVYDRNQADHQPVRVGQHIPLLDEAGQVDSDSDDQNSPAKQTSSDVIFDVLNRRNARR